MLSCKAVIAIDPTADIGAAVAKWRFVRVADLDHCIAAGAIAFCLQMTAVRDLAAVDLEDQFLRYRARATRHADGDAPNLPWKALLKASCEAK